MKAFLKDVGRTTLIYELVTFGGLTAFLIVAPLFGYLPYSDRPGSGWFGRFPALGWSDFWGNTWQMASFGAFFGLIALQLAVPCAVLIVATHRFMDSRFWLSISAVILLAGATFYLVPAVGWYVALGVPAMWVGVACGALAGYLCPPEPAPISCLTGDGADALRPSHRPQGFRAPMVS